jgi:hypothetical protein
MDLSPTHANNSWAGQITCGYEFFFRRDTVIGSESAEAAQIREQIQSWRTTSASIAEYGNRLGRFARRPLNLTAGVINFFFEHFSNLKLKKT